MVPESWGGATASRAASGLEVQSHLQTAAALQRAPHASAAGEQLNYGFQLFLTPFKPLHTDEQWP